MMWKDKIDSELIDMFLDRLFQECKYSIFDFERVLADYGMENIKVPFEDDDCTKDCPHLEELNETIKKLNGEIKRKKEDSIRNNKLYLDMKKKYKEHKKNSVLFTMDDEGF